MKDVSEYEEYIQDMCKLSYNTLKENNPNIDIAYSQYKTAVYPYFIKVATEINKKAHNGAILEAMDVVATNALKRKLGIY